MRLSIPFLVASNFLLATANPISTAQATPAPTLEARRLGDIESRIAHLSLGHHHSHAKPSPTHHLHREAGSHPVTATRKVQAEHKPTSTHSHPHYPHFDGAREHHPEDDDE
ncbi:hypothetical protein CC86DRAFT_384846 [Ophiobolus disseminans]|uniref:Uncharacterized protein n=1 Tax=Ophiobolus disseminans TaxID=1469910 RepID=A0A6A6ZRT7_9PLEO|nr:hypothetical protein CC86DRAFT_384846 [Ophiobolus disseminans]